MIHSYFVKGREAYRAYRDGTGDDVCPYMEGSEPRRSWNAGWDHEWFADVVDSPDE